ncbi:MAG: methyltransferase domain-containing protein [Alphaproteobacteria bacterium]|nr:methyltransferase domain-containing protein [Alphaproteobacteria bacterium]
MTAVVLNRSLSGPLAVPAGLSRATVADGPKLPLGKRLRAWWNGYDPRDLQPGPKKVPLPIATAKDADIAAAMAAEPDRAPPKPATPWPAERIALVERLWGEGFHTPGGAEHLLELAKPMAINQTMTMLDLGCGLGGASRTIAESFGTWCTGVEWCAPLAMAGVERSTKAGLVKKAAVQYHAADRMMLKASAYNAVFSKEALFTVADKQVAIQGIADTLRPGGQFCFTDYVVPTKAEYSFNIRDWQGREPLGAHPWSVEEYRECLSAHGFDVRVAEDMTDRHCALIRQGWQRLVQEMKPGSVSPELMPIMVREAEIWGSREALLRKGEIKLYRFFALKSF